MADWYHKFPVVCSLVSIALGLKMMADKQLASDSRLRDTISLLEAVKLPAEPAAPSKPLEPKPPAPKPKEPAPVVVRTLVMHSMTPCIYCRTDKAKIIPRWISLGYNVTYIDEGNGIPGSRYPWYEINDQNGKRVHVGSLEALK